MAFGEVLREFGVKVTLDFDSKKFEAAQEKVEKFGEKLKGFALGVTALTAGLFESQNLFTSNARSLQNQADLLGINTKQLQEYEYAAKVAADVNRDELVGSLQQLGDTMDKARAGDVAARQALEQIGGAGGNTAMIIGRLNDKTYKVTDAFKDLSVGISAISKTSPQAAARLTEQTVGNAKLLNLLRQGPKAIQDLTEEGGRNFALNERMIRQGYQMDIQMSKLWMVFRKFGYEIGFNVMKHLAPMIAQFEKWFQANKKLISSGITGFLDATADALKAVWKTSLELVAIFEPLVEKFGGMEKVTRGAVQAFLAFKAINLGVAFAKAAVGAGEMAVAFAPITAVVAGLASLAGIIQSVWTLLKGGDLKDTWLGQLGDKLNNLTGGKLNIGDKIYDFLHPDANQGALNQVSSAGSAIQTVRATGVNPGGGGGSSAAPGVAQENHFTTQNTIMVPPGTTPTAASAMISKANVDSYEQMMIKTKADAGSNRLY